MPDFRTLRASDPRFEHESLRHITVKSPALGRRADLTLYLPAEGPERDLPLVLLLHGVYGSHWAWAYKGGVHRTAQRMIDAGELPPLAIAMPSDGLWGDGSGYLPHPERNAERWIVDEVPAAVAQETGRTSSASPLFIGGLSMGGFGALRLGATHGSRFRGISGHSSVIHLERLKTFVEEPIEAFGVPPEHCDALGALVRHKATLPPLRFDCGTEDPLLEDNRALHAALDAAGIPHTYEEFPGGHEWTYWERQVVRTLRFFGGILNRGTAQ
ncbi:MAG: alpha/beta hydrolase-fold protein [Rhodothermales bacterium]|nr:alpha/beta hydrolase-fold protein [Rhodothermales bacterium]